jgi:hypothetical protein
VDVDESLTLKSGDFRHAAGHDVGRRGLVDVFQLEIQESEGVAAQQEAHALGLQGVDLPGQVRIGLCQLEQGHATGEAHQTNLHLSVGRLQVGADIAQQLIEVCPIVGQAPIVLMDDFLERILARWDGGGHGIGRLGGVGMLGDQGDREVAGDIARRQTAKGQGHEPRLQQSRGAPQAHQHRIAPMRAE